MSTPTKLLAATQRTWPLLYRLSLIVAATPAAWVVATAREISHQHQLSPGERAACQAYCRRSVDQLARLRRQWRGTLLLALLLAIAVVVRAMQVPLDTSRIVIFAISLQAIVLPAIAIYIGMTYEFVAASALLQALRSRSE